MIKRLIIGLVAGLMIISTGCVDTQMAVQKPSVIQADEKSPAVQTDEKPVSIPPSEKSTAVQAVEKPAGVQEKPSADQAIQILKEGNNRFVQGKAVHPHSDAERIKLADAENQANHAYATILSCSDSRVPVERIFDAGIMDIFVVRVAGNVCNTDEIGSIEYGLAHVKTPVLVILGHTKCGAVTAVTEAVHGAGHALERNIPPLVRSIEPAVRRAIAEHKDIKGNEIVPYAIEENIWQAIENLFMASPATRNMVKANKAKIVGAIYDLSTGKVNWLPDDKVSQILEKVEKNPKRANEAMAPEKKDSKTKGH